jgi:PAS domain S-box-containing protein
MTNFLLSQLDFIFFFYGLGFILLAGVCFVLDKSREYSLPWKWLGFFALIRGLNEWLEMLALSFGESTLFESVRITVLGISFLFLLEFGRLGLKSIGVKVPGRWITFVLLLAGLTGGMNSLNGLNATLGYFLGFTGGICSALVFIYVSSDNKKQNQFIFISGMLIAIFAVITGIIVPRVSFFPGSFLNQSSFLQIFGIPVQLFRGLIACLITFFLFKHNQRGRVILKRINVWLFTFLVFVILVCGWYVVELVGQYKEKQEKNDIYIAARMTAAALKPERIKSLYLNNSIKNPDYISLKEHLMKMKESNSELYLVYFAALKGDSIVILADSNPENSKEYLPPGRLFIGAPEELFNIFHLKLKSSINPGKEESGKWYSTFVPVYNCDGNNVCVVLGVDRSTESLNLAVYHDRIMAIMIILLILVILIAFYTELERKKELIEGISNSEIAIKVSEEKFRSIVENLGEGISFLNSNEQFVFANNATEEIFGVGSGQLVGMNLNQFVFGKQYEWVQEETIKRAQGKKSVYELEVLRPNGVKRNIIVTAVPLIDKESGFVGTYGVIRDITGSKRAELERQITHEIAQGITTTSNLDELLNLIHQSLGKVLYAENYFVALYDQNTELFSFPYWVDKFDPAPEPVAMQKSCTAYIFRTGKPLLLTQKLFDDLVEQNEVELVGTNSPSWVGVPLESPDRIIGVLVLQHYEEENIYSEHDVEFLNSAGRQIAIAIERKRAEKEIQELNEQLLKSNFEKDKFFSIIAHDLRSPFHGFIALTEMMSEDISSFSTDELSKLAHEMSQSAQNLFNLLQNLLEWAQFKKGSLSFTPQVLSLSTIVSKCIEQINQRVIQKGITIINEVPGNQKIFADEMMINSILNNLLSNAVKFTNRNGTVTVSAKEIEDQMIEISFRDTGVGMPKSIVKKMFKVGEKTGRKGTEGELSTGLGLLLCKEFIDKNGGKIWVESEEGAGSTFYFTVLGSKYSSQ